MMNDGGDDEYEEIELPEGGGPPGGADEDGEGGGGDAELADVAEGEEDEDGNVVPVDPPAPLTVTDVDNSRAVGRAHGGSVYALALAPGGGGAAGGGGGAGGGGVAVADSSSSQWTRASDNTAPTPHLRRRPVLIILVW